MALDYRSDLADVFPPYVFAHREVAAMLADVGLSPNSTMNKIMLFHDPRTVFAAGAAGPNITEPLLKAGFGLTPLSQTRDEEKAKRDFLMERLKPMARRYRKDAAQRQEVRVELANLFEFSREFLIGIKSDRDGRPLNYEWALRVEQPVEPFEFTEYMRCVATQNALEEGDASHTTPMPEPRKRSWLGRVFGGRRRV